MVFTKWGDAVSVQKSDALTLSMTGLPVDADLLSTMRDSPNLVIKALYAMADATGHDTNLSIVVRKNIPSGGGLGGGSSNAAATMHALNELWRHPLSMDELCAIGLKFGAEMPVCIRGQSTHVQGVGDVLTSKNVPSMPILIVWPDTPLLTVDVFQKFKRDGVAFDDVSLISKGVKNGKNSLTDTAISLCPDIQKILSNIENLDGCEFARMSGTGSACFGVFKTDTQAQQGVRHFKNAVSTRTI